MKQYYLSGIFSKLRGNIDFHGETYRDGISIDNIHESEADVYQIVVELCDTYDDTKDRHEASAHDINEAAKATLVRLKELIDDTLKEDI